MNTATAITIAALTALTPTVTCLIGIILSRQDVRRLEDRIDQKLDKVDQRLKVIEDQLMHFYSITGRLEGRLDTIEKRAS